MVLIAASVLLWLCLLSYHCEDASWNTAAAQTRPHNLVGPLGARLADLGAQTFGLAAYTLPILLLLLAWKWLRSEALEAPAARALGAALFMLSLATLASVAPGWRVFGGAVPAGGLAGTLLAEYLESVLNVAGTVVLALTCLVLSVYLFSTFSFAKARNWCGGRLGTMASWFERRKPKSRVTAMRDKPLPPMPPLVQPEAEAAPAPPPEPPVEIPIRTLEEIAPPVECSSEPLRREEPAPERKQPEYQLPSTDLLNEPPGRGPFDEQELKEIAARIKSKFEEFNVLGSVVQINPGPVVTTFEFKPEAGIKYSRITTLTEDLCLGLQAESILIERIPGKPTVGIEVPNSRRELIGLRQIMESDEIHNTAAKLPIPIGKDINGRIKIAPLESMPHLLIAGSTGSGKSVLLNSM
ncbi:MAG: DNA translocase FtsK 4TM domain-containing protein, partial [Acidobacteriota bacterium]